MRKCYWLIVLGVLLCGCSLQVSVRDGDCKPIDNAAIYYTREGIYSFAPFQAVTNQEGIVTLPTDTDTISVNKEGYKPAFIENPASQNIDIFMYTDPEDYESGLINYNNCTKKE